MKRILLIAGSAFAAHGAFAADTLPAPAPRTAAAATAMPSTDANADAKTVEARKELAELRTQMQELSRKMAALSNELGERGPRSYAYRYISDPDRAMIGVVFGMSDGHVVVGAMTPDGPAARAGLHGSDIVTAIDHQSIDAKTVLESAAKAKELLDNLKAGQNVTIEYIRDGKKGVVTFPAERREAWNWPQMMAEDPEHPFLPKDFNERMRANVERAERDAERTYERDHERIDKQVERATREAMKHVPPQAHIAMPWWGLNLAPLNADLGHYFGTDKGVLVIAADVDSLPGIRAGDVITSVAGESVSRPEDALRALRDKKSGEDVPIKLLRDRKSIALNMKAPQFNSIFNLGVPPPRPPVPAAPAAPPAPASPASPAMPALPVASPPAPPAAPAPPELGKT